MKIVVVDAHAMNPGDLDWGVLAEFGEYHIYPNSSRAECIERCADAQMAITNKVIFDREVIAALPQLRYIGVTATGYNNVDIDAADERGVVVTNVPAYSTESVAQTTFALLLELTHRVGHHSQTVSDGRWSRSAFFCYWDYPLIELSGLTMGVIGCGQIGRSVARIANAFGMRVLCHSRSAFEVEGVQSASLPEVFSQSDVVSLHCPLNEDTHHIVNKNTLGLMKPTAFLINTGRGPLVNENDLANALNTERIAGAGLDVLAVEPPAPDNPLLSAKNCIITPHIAWATLAARRRLLQVTVKNIARYLAGDPINVVSNKK